MCVLQRILGLVSSNPKLQFMPLQYMSILHHRDLYDPFLHLLYLYAEDDMVPVCRKGVQTSSRARVFSCDRRKQQITFDVRCQAASSIADVENDVAQVKEAPVLPFRVGHGFDLHRLEPGLPLIIGGVNIPHDRGCEAHSDGM